MGWVMSKLEELIEKLCPDGVEYIELKYLSEIGTGSSNRQDAIENGLYPFYVRSKDTLRINFYEFEEEAIIIPGEGGIGEIFHYVNGKYALHQRAYRIHILNSKLNTKFLYYYMKQNFKQFIYMKAVSATVTSIRKPMIEKFAIPIPPIEVQKEIVRILDNFTELTAELIAELTARKKQYEYYRDTLLVFDKNDKSIQEMTLGDVGKVSMCKRIMKAETSSEGDIPFYKIGTFGKEPDAYISYDKYSEYKNKFSYPNKGDILISASGTIGKTVVYNGEPAYYQDSNIVWLSHDESIILNKYLYYYYQLQPWNVAAGGTIARLYNDNISKTKILVPPLEEQQRIVSILDRFDTLCNDITKGLPAEIEARKKQYEYYRDKLLTFKQLRAEAEELCEGKELSAVECEQSRQEKVAS